MNDPKALRRGLKLLIKWFGEYDPRWPRLINRFVYTPQKGSNIYRALELLSDGKPRKRGEIIKEIGLRRIEHHWRASQRFSGEAGLFGIHLYGHLSGFPHLVTRDKKGFYTISKIGRETLERAKQRKEDDQKGND